MLDSSSKVRGKGYAVGALKMKTAFAFEHLDVGRVVFGTAADNLPMKGLLERHLELTACWREEMRDWEFVLTRDVWETWAESGLVVEELDPSC
jgi:RimJ/RimL family protein N-acetyltransferase